jgi:hypothetical protein
VRGKSVKVRKQPDGTSSVFKSTTGRLLEENISKAAKAQTGIVG